MALNKGSIRHSNLPKKQKKMAPSPQIPAGERSMRAALTKIQNIVKSERAQLSLITHATSRTSKS